MEPNGPSVTIPPARAVVQDYLTEFDKIVGAIDTDALVRVVERLRRARDGHRTVFIAGNGGSAATASHFANDLGKAAKHPSHLPFRVMSLGDNTSWVTALGNDEGFERVFAGQLENFATAGDVLVVISASGNSPNLVEAVTLAQARDLQTIGFLGFNGGKLLEQVDEAVWVKTEPGQYGVVETTHALLCDIVTTCLIADRGVTAPRDE